MLAEGDTVRRIREVAHEIYLDRVENGKPGDALSDWLEAERLTGLHAPPETGK